MFKMSYVLSSMAFLSVLQASAVIANSLPENPANGQVYQDASAAQVWHEEKGEWLTPQAFWLDYAESASGKFWGRGDDYPPYSEVSEHDTLLVDVDGGTCLMYFYHGRWRRAQDVRRWDPAFNELLGCPNVFK